MPPLTLSNVKEIIQYLDNSDYSQISNYPMNWSDIPPSQRTRAKNDRTWGGGAMIHEFAEVSAPVHSIQWEDSRNGGCTSYECNDIGKLLRILKKLNVTANGSVTGEGFAHEGDTYFIVDNSIHCARLSPGPKVFVDGYESDDEKVPQEKDEDEEDEEDEEEKVVVSPRGLKRPFQEEGDEGGEEEEASEKPLHTGMPEC